MKKTVFSILLMAGFSLSFHRSAAQHSLQQVWKSDTTFEFCEGIAPSADGKFMYVSNTVGSPMEKDGKGTISMIDFNGKILKHNWVTGMNAPKDIQRYKNLIYAADLDELAVIDVDKAAVINRIKIGGAMLLHNIAIDAKGTVYVSDLFAGKVHKVENGKVSLYLDSLGYAGGLLAKGTDLYVLTGGNLIKVDKDKKITTLSTGMDRNMNGLQMVNDNEFLVTAWPGVIYYVAKDGSNQILLDTRKDNIASGIIHYDPAKKMMYMTTDAGNYLLAYKVK